MKKAKPKPKSRARPANPPTRRARARRVVLSLLATLGLASVFTTSLLAGVVLHVNLPAVRRVTAAELSRALTDVFYGSVSIGTVEHLGLRGATVSEVTVLDEKGERVLTLSGVRIRTDVLTLLRDVVFAEDKITVIVRSIRADSAEVQIAPDPTSGVPTIARALTPVPSAPKKPSKPSAPSKPVRVWLPAIDIARIYARGTVAGLPTLELTLGHVRGSVLTTPKGVAVDVARYGVTVRGVGGTDATGTGDLHVRVPGAVWGSFDGFFGNLPVATSVQVRGTRVVASLDVPKGMPEDLRVLLPEWPIRQPVSAHIEASGDVPQLNANARFEVGGAKITAVGPMRLDRQLSIDLDVQGRNVDLRALWPEAPKTNVNVDAALAIFDKNGQLVVDVNGTTAATKLLGQPIPPIDVNGTFNEKGFNGKATVHEHGMPLKVGLAVSPAGVIDIDARAPSFQIERAPRVSELTGARGRADMEVKARIEKAKIAATVAANLSGFELGDVKLGRGRLTGSAKGPLAQPDKLDIDARLEGSTLATRGVSFQSVKATAKGPVERPRVTAKLSDETNPLIDAEATLITRGKPGVRDLRVAVRRDGVSLGGKIRQLDFGATELEIESLALTGAGGDLTGAARIGPGRFEVKAKGTGLDLDAVTRALRLPRGLLGGRLNVDADVVATRRESRGHVHIGLGNGSIASFGGIALALDADLDGADLSGTASAMMEDVGSLGASFQGKLDGSAAEPRSWLGITGSTELQLSDVELSLLRHVLPRSLRIEKIAGTAFARLRVERARPNELPNLRVEIAGTRGLELERAPEKKGDEPQTLSGVEILTVGAGVSGEKGDASGTTQLVDQHGALVTASTTLRMDWRKLLANPDNWLALMKESPVLLVVSMDERPFATLPKIVRPSEIEGSIRGRVMLSGTFAEPRVSANLGLSGLRSPKSRRELPVDLVATGEYEPSSGRYGSDVQLLANRRRVARLSARGTANWHDGSWTTGAQLVLEEVPLSVVPALADSYVDGKLEGTVALQRPSADVAPRLSATVNLKDASVDRTPLGAGTLTARSDAELARAELSLDDQTGRFTAEVLAGLDWSTGTPALDRSRPVRIEAEAKEYDAAVLSPFLRDLFSRLTGKVDGKLSIALETPRGVDGKPTGEWQSRINGDAKLRDGIVQLAELGLELTDVSFSASARDTGRFAVIEVDDVEGRARSEIPNVKANARLFLEGVRFVRGTASLSIKEVPLLLQGVSMATATGSATMKVERAEKEMLVTVDVPVFTAKLPETAGRSVVDLGDNPAIEVVQPLREPRPVRTGEILPWRFVVNLARGVRLRRSDLEIPIIGQPVIVLAQKAEVGGYVELEPGGRFQSWGKTFVIDTGRVIFDTPDPADPHIAVGASWRGPDGTIVYADVRGTLKQAKVTVSSDPPRSEPEIMALLFGGSSGSEEATAARSRESSAAAGGVLATAFNALFAESLSGGPVQVELRTSTNEDKASYTAAVKVAENVWFEGTYRNRLEAQQDTTSTEPVDVSGTVDWRFRRNWSLRTEVGTLGTGLDLLFQYRY